MSVAIQAVTWFDWAKILIPPLLTASIAIFAAVVAYVFAKRGRKEDILYKEKYKSFEAVAGFLFEIMRFVDETDETTRILKIVKSRLPNAAKYVFEELEKISKNEPNRRHLVLLNSDTRKAYYLVVGSLDQLLKKTYYLSKDIEGRKTVVRDYEEEIAQIEAALKQLKRDANTCQQLAFDDLELPRR